MVLFFLRLKRMRKCRNWQTSKTKDLVSIALVWVQVPSSAFCFSKWKSLRLPFYVYKQISIMQLWRNWHTRMIQVHVRVNWVWVPAVSYTHLTLPTIYSVEISVGAASLKKKKARKKKKKYLIHIYVSKIATQ